MAVIDPRTEAVVIRIAYDGAPMAGKSTSVRALGKGLGASVVTPAEVGGRTLYFDWLDYTGGLFEGRAIRCQIVSVPGQASLAPRRRKLLEEADVVVYVGDSTPAGLHADRGYLAGMRRILDEASPPVGVVVQANKRDHADAVPIERIREMLEAAGVRASIVESVASDGAGVREAFVYAVRLALDRVRELSRTGALRTALPTVDGADQLLEEVRRREGGSLDLAVQEGRLGHTRLADVEQGSSLMSDALAQVMRENQVEAAPVPPPVPMQEERVAAGAAGVPAEPAAPVSARVAEPSVEPVLAERTPAAPDGRVPSGLVWPPVDGRMILNELSGAKVELNRSARGDWWGHADGRWRLLSPADALYEDIEDGRNVLVSSARAQSVRLQGRVVDRCVVLAPDGAGRFRLWNVARVADGAGEGFSVVSRG